MKRTTMAQTIVRQKIVGSKTFSEIIVLPCFLVGLRSCSIIIEAYDNKKGSKFYNDFVIVRFNDF